jgi:SAM-dependent methyltransferase
MAWKTMSIKKNLQIYEQKAQNYAEAYRSLKSPDVLPYFTDRLAKVSKPESFMVLDLACGSGRDAAYMAEMGFTVIAVDGSKEMLSEAHRCNGHPSVEYMQDIGPEFNALIRRGQKFDVILISSFLFHLDKAERKQFYRTLSMLAAEDCYLHILLRYGPCSDDRVMFDVPVKELEDFAGQYGFKFSQNAPTKDKLNRSDVFWRAVDLNRGYIKGLIPKA